MNRALILTLLSLLVACKTADPTNVVVENAYPRDVVVYKTWWEPTLFTEPVLPGAASEEQRTVPETDTAYVLLAPGWDPASGEPPKVLWVAQSKAPIQAKRGKTLRITVSDATFAGNCEALQPLTQEEADFITQRIFPGEFADKTYDAKTCVTTAIQAADSGVDAPEE